MITTMIRIMIRIMVLLALCLSESVIFLSDGFAKTLTVSPTGAGQFRKIQEAINEAAPGDTILVSAGVYKEHIDLKDEITLKGAGKDACRVEYNGANTVVTAIEVTNGLIDGFTIAYTGGSPQVAILVESSSLTISNNSIRGSVISGIEIRKSFNPTIEKNIITANRENGILIHSNSKVNVVANEITNNSLSAIELRNFSEAAIENNLFNSNNGGGIFIHSNSKATVVGNEITNNQVTAVEIKGASEAVIEGNLFSLNKEGGIFIYDRSKAKIINNRIVNNGLHGLELNGNPQSEVINNVIVKNAQAGILVYNAASPIIKNNIIIKNQIGISTGNVQGQISNGNPSVSFNDVWNNFRNYVVLSKPATDISVDPKFIDEASGNYYLQPDSPAIGAGEGGADMGLSSKSAPSGLKSMITTMITTITATSPVIADGISTSIITISIKDQNGKPIPNKTIAVFASGSDNIIIQPSSPTDQNGEATAKFRSTKAESKTISVKVDGIPVATTAKVEFLPDVVSPANSTIITSGSAIADGIAQIKLTIILLDANKNAIKGQKVVITATGTSNILVQPEKPTDENGMTTAFISSIKAEEKRLSVTVEEIKLKPIVVTFSPPPQPKLIIRATSPHLADGEDTSNIILVLTDANGNPMPKVNLTVSATGKGNILIQPASPTDASGRTIAKLRSTFPETKNITATYGFDGQQIQATTTVEFNPSPKPLLLPPPTQLAVVGNLIKADNVLAVEITGKASPNAQMNISVKDGINTVQKIATSDASGSFKVIVDATLMRDGNIAIIASEVGGQEASIIVVKDTKPLQEGEKPDFSIITLNPTQSIEVGKKAIYIISLLSKRGFKSDLTLRVADAPKGTEAEFDPKIVSVSAEKPSESSQLTIRVGSETPIGDHKFIVLATASDKSIKQIELQLQVIALALKKSFITIDVEPEPPRLEDKLKVKGTVISEEGEVKLKLPLTINYKPPKGEEITQSLQTDELGEYAKEIEVNQKGKWEITVSWIGDKTYKAAKKTKTVEVQKGASQIVWQPLQTTSVKIGSLVKIVSSLQTLVKREPLRNETVNLDIIKPTGTKKIQKATTTEFGNFEFEVQFEMEGSWLIEASWDGSEDYLNAKSETLTVPVSKENAKAIIVLGGGDENENPDWNQFAGLANYVYKIFKKRELTDDDIYYLSPTEKKLASVDSRTSKEALKFAITDWAAKRTNKNTPLYIYLLSHSLNDKFLLEKSADREVVLTPEDLASWLEALDKEIEITLMIEACYSGNFITKKRPSGEPVLSKSNRVIITSAKEDKQALILKNFSSFSKSFFDQIVKNENVNTAFLRGRDSIRALRSQQSPQVDANGDGRANDPTRDFPAVEKKHIPEFRLYLASPAPVIKEVIAKPKDLKVGEKSSTIEVKVVGTDIRSVYANAVPPTYDPNKMINSWGDLKFDEITLKKIEEGIYKGEYNNFVLPGEYSIVVYAENPDGSAVPAETTVKVLSVSVEPTVKAKAAPWDINSDGEVNIFDLVIVAKNIGQEVKEGDVNEDDKVDIFDLVTVASHFGEKTTSASPSIESASTPIDYSQYLPLLEKAYQLLQASSKSDSSADFEMAMKLLEHLIFLSKSKAVVKETKLLPNYPNPFNPETWIPYQLSEAAEVTIQIYNVTGKLIRTMKLGPQVPGLYIDKGKAAYWDGRNGAGEYVSSGVYFYELVAGNFRSVRKMTILR